MDIKETLRNHLKKTAKQYFENEKHFTEAVKSKSSKTEIRKAMATDTAVNDLASDFENGIFDTFEAFMDAHPDFEIAEEKLIEMITTAGQNAIELYFADLFDDSTL